MAPRDLFLIILPFTVQAIHTGWFPNKAHHALLKFARGGSSTAADTAPTSELSLDDRVQAAMRRLGLDNNVDGDVIYENSQKEDNGIIERTLDCEGGVCTAPTTTADTVESSSSLKAPGSTSTQEEPSQDMVSIATSIASEYDVPRDIVMAAIYSSFSGEGENMRIDEELARSIVKAEVEAIRGVSEDCDEVKQLITEGFDPFFSRRSLAFSDMNVDDARAILVADQEDEDAEQQEMKAKEVEESQQPMKTITVDYPKDFDPTVAISPPEPSQQQKPTPAKKEDVVFEGTTADLQKLVLESPVPVLLDVYADWCGPCKQLTPALEQIVINAGGMLRLVKINTDQQRQISSALMVTSLPTVFGIKNGRIVHMFMGMPRDENMLRNFLMGLMVPGQAFNPPVTSEEKTKYEELSSKLLKLGAAASFSFSARERLQNKILKDLDELVTVISADEDEGSTMGMAVADDTARVLRSLMSNVIQNPFEVKFRTIKLDNKVIAAKVAKYTPCLSILRSIGFAEDGESILTVAKGKKIVNIAPFVTGRDMIDKWIDKNRYQIAAANRKRKDEIERVRLAAQAEQIAKNEADSSELEEIEDEINTFCGIKVRVEGKRKVHDIKCEEDDSLNDLVAKLPFSIDDDEMVQFTCAAKRLIVKSTDIETMQKTLAQLNLTPTASIVVKIGESKTEFSKGSLAERVSSTQKKTGSHSMHSIGLYAKDDGNKAEMFDGGGGVMYEHDISDDEVENKEQKIEEHALDEEMADKDNASNNSD